MTTSSRLQVSLLTLLKEKHLTTESCGRLENCENCKKSLTSELVAKRRKTVNQLARVDDVDTKRSKDTLSKEMLYECCNGVAHPDGVQSLWAKQLSYIVTEYHSLARMTPVTWFVLMSGEVTE